jgi:activator of HSP90 ATPase
MAKWGEGKFQNFQIYWKSLRNLYWIFSLLLECSRNLGDPRWIVEERPDATNVNNWHWKESDATSWSKDKLNELFLQLDFKDDKNLSCKIIEFDKLSGEATANNRKGKLIYFYEWDIVMKWEGRILNDDEGKKIKGKVTIPNLSEENSLEEIEINITTEEFNDKSDLLRQFMNNVGRPKIRELLGKYMESLKNDYAKNLLLPRRDDVQVNTKIKKWI